MRPVGPGRKWYSCCMTFSRVLFASLAAALLALGCDSRPIAGGIGLGGDAGFLTGSGGTLTGSTTTGDGGPAEAGAGDAGGGGD
jgi:hypothetical protein